MLTVLSAFKDGLVHLALMFFVVIVVLLCLATVLALAFGPALVAEAYNNPWYLLLYTVTVVVVGLLKQVEVI